MSFVINMIGTKLLKDIVIRVAEVLSARTDNKFDDEIVQKIKEVI